jgi:hypothetical protein
VDAVGGRIHGGGERGWVEESPGLDLVSAWAREVSERETEVDGVLVRRCLREQGPLVCGALVLSIGLLVPVRVSAGATWLDLILATVDRITAIHGTDIAIVATERSGTAARPPAAYIVGGTGVPVIAGGGVEGVVAHATDADVVGARVAIGAVDGYGRTRSPATNVAARTCVTIVAQRIIVRVDTANSGIAQIVRALVGVIAIARRPTQAAPSATGVAIRAGVTVATRI